MGFGRLVSASDESESFMEMFEKMNVGFDIFWGSWSIAIDTKALHRLEEA